VAILEQVGGERVAQRVGGRVFVDSGGSHRDVERALQHGFMKMVAALLSGFSIAIVAGRWEDPLPPPLLSGVRVLSRESVRKLDPARAGLEVLRMLRSYRGDVASEVGFDPGRKHRATVARTLPGSHNHFVARKIHVLHAEPAALEQAKP
jgi:hypothetical protein